MKVALKAAQKARAKGGLATFACPNIRGDLRITPAFCASCYRAGKTATDEAKIRLLHCNGCEVGAANAAEIAVPPPARRDRSVSYGRGGTNSRTTLPEILTKTLEFIRVRGSVTAVDAAKHFGRHRDTMTERLSALEGMGLLKRAQGPQRTLIWSAVE